MLLPFLFSNVILSNAKDLFSTLMCFDASLILLSAKFIIFDAWLSKDINISKSYQRFSKFWFSTLICFDVSLNSFSAKFILFDAWQSKDINISKSYQRFSKFWFSTSICFDVSLNSFRPNSYSLMPDFKGYKYIKVLSKGIKVPNFQFPLPLGRNTARIMLCPLGVARFEVSCCKDTTSFLRWTNLRSIFFSKFPNGLRRHSEGLPKEDRRSTKRQGTSTKWQKN